MILKKRILIFNGHTRTGSTLRVATSIAGVLQAHGFDVMFACTKIPQFEWIDDRTPTFVYGESLRTAFISFGEYISGLITWAALFTYLLFTQRRFDILITCDNPHSLPLLRLLAEKTVYYCHEAEPCTKTPDGVLTAFLMDLMNYSATFGLSQADKVLANNDHGQNSLNAFYGIDSSIVYPATRPNPELACYIYNSGASRATPNEASSINSETVESMFPSEEPQPLRVDESSSTSRAVKGITVMNQNPEVSQVDECLGIHHTHPMGESAEDTSASSTKKTKESAVNSSQPEKTVGVHMDGNGPDHLIAQHTAIPLSVDAEVDPDTVFSLESRNEYKDLQVLLPWRMSPYEFVIVSIGALRPNKHHLIALRAFKEAQSRGMIGKIIIAGALDENNMYHGRYYQLLKAYIQHAGLHASATVVPNIAEAAKQALYARASVSLYLSKTSRVCLGILEALSYQTPVISLSNGCSRSLLVNGKSGLLLSPEFREPENAPDESFLFTQEYAGLFSEIKSDTTCKDVGFPDPPIVASGSTSVSVNLVGSSLYLQVAANILKIYQGEVVLSARLEQPHHYTTFTAELISHIDELTVKSKLL